MDKDNFHSQFTRKLFLIRKYGRIHRALFTIKQFIIFTSKLNEISRKCSIKINHKTPSSCRENRKFRIFQSNDNFSMAINCCYCSSHATDKHTYIVYEKNFSFACRVESKRTRTKYTCVRFSVFNTSNGEKCIFTTFESTSVSLTGVASARLTICPFVRLSRSQPTTLSSGYICILVCCRCCYCCCWWYILMDV